MNKTKYTRCEIWLNLSPFYYQRRCYHVSIAFYRDLRITRKAPICRILFYFTFRRKPHLVRKFLALVRVLGLVTAGTRCSDALRLETAGNAVLGLDPAGRVELILGILLLVKVLLLGPRVTDLSREISMLNLQGTWKLQ